MKLKAMLLTAHDKISSIHDFSSPCIMTTFSAHNSPHIKNIIAQTSGPIINSFGTISEDINDDLLERILITPTPSKPSYSAAVEMIKTLHCVLERKKKSMLEMLPPKSCVLFEPISESFHKGNYRVGIRPLHFQFHCSSSPLSTSSASDASEGLTSRLLELLGFSSLVNLEQESKS
ncbi:hypothetical protein CFP56_015714 [Quercus suber]|uniref:Uncharacterized protein n=1 Tax=Quercus suber TaxID=58331 RepID=A0AAW0KRP9_QUESU